MTNRVCCLAGPVPDAMTQNASTTLTARHTRLVMNAVYSRERLLAGLPTRASFRKWAIIKNASATL